MRDVERGAGDPDDGGLEVNVFPLEATQLLATHTSEHEHLDHRLELHIFALDQLQKPAGLFLVVQWGPRRAHAVGRGRMANTRVPRGRGIPTGYACRAQPMRTRYR